MFQTKEQYKSPDTNPIETEISDLPNGRFKIIVTEMLTEIRRSMSEQCENFNKEKI